MVKEQEMSELKVYHYPGCRKSRAGLQYLRDSGAAFTVLEYMKYPLTIKDMERLLVKLDMKPAGLIRTGEDYYKQHLKGKKFEDHELIRIMLENPRLIRRPLVEGQYRAVIGDPPENIGRLLEKR